MDNSTTSSTKTAEQLITENIDVWTSAIKKRGSQGRGSSKKVELYGLKKLRELILELAVRGLLVPQDSSDEPASVLLEKIAVEKEQLVKGGKTKKQKSFSGITESKRSIDLPSGWESASFGKVAIIERGGSPRPIKSFLTNDPDGLNWIKIGDTEQGGKYITSTKEKIIKEGLSKTRMVYPGDFLLTNSMSFGRPYISNITGCIHDGWLRISPPSTIDKNFLYILLSSPFIIKAFKKSASGAVVLNLNADKVREVELLIPPEAEQSRIVAKVDELMSLCDQLEQQTEANLTAHQTLVETLLNALLYAAQTSSALTSVSGQAATLPASSKVPETKESDLIAKKGGNEGTENLQGVGGNTESETISRRESSFEAAWNRIAEHFDILFTTERSIDQLKQTILQLAVMGKLVPQDPSDEPASVLLEKIAAEKEQLIKDKKIKKQKPLPPISEDEKPFELPNGWEWCRLGDLALNSEAGWSPKCNGHSREGGKWGVLKVSAVSWGEYRPEENKELPDNLEPREQYEVVGGDFLISRANTAELVARAVVVPENSPVRLMMSDKIIRFSFSDLVENEYINLANASRISRDYYAAVAGGTSSSMKNVSREQIRNLVVALPPIEEAKRIFNQYSSALDVCNTLRNNILQSKNIQLHLAVVMAEEALA